MADNALGPNEPRSGADRVEPLTDDGPDPMLSALGYEAADPVLQARLWGEAVMELRT